MRAPAQPTAVCISVTAAAINGSDPVAVSYRVPTSVLGPTAGVMDGEPTSPVTDVGLVRVNAVPASTPKLLAVPRAKGVPELKQDGAGIEVTVKMEAGEVLPLKVAVMFDVPAATPVATPPPAPFGDIVAIKGLAEFQEVAGFVVTSTLDPSPYVANALNIWTAPIDIVADGGVTRIDSTVAAVTVNLAVPV